MRQVYFLLFMLMSFFNASGNEPMLKNYWLNERHLPIKTNDIAQDDLGYLWLATDVGLYRYNGLEFVKIGTGEPITAIVYFEDKIVVGLAQGVLKFVKGNTLQDFKLSGYKSGHDILNFNIKDEKELWLCTEAGIWHIDKGTARQLTAASGLSDPYTYDVDFWSGHKAIAASDKGLSLLSLLKDPKVTGRIAVADGLADNIVRTIAVDKKLLWIGTQTGGIQLYDVENKRFFAPANPYKAEWGEIVDIEAIANGRAVAATSTGLLLHLSVTEAGKFLVNEYAQLPAAINEIFLDKTGNIWCGTNNGISLVLSERISHIVLPKPYDIKLLTSLCIASNGDLWLGLDTKLYRYQFASKQMQLTATASGKITCLFEDSKRNLWMGTINHGVAYMAGGKAKIIIPKVEAIANATVLSIQQRSEEIWLAGLNGIDVLREEKETGQYTYKGHYSKKDGAGSDYIYALHKDRNNNMWVASDGGSVRQYNGHQFISWPALSDAEQQVAYAIAEDNKGKIWFADLDYKLNSFDGKIWRRYDTWTRENSGELSVLTTSASNYVVRCFPDRVEFFNAQRQASWRFEIASWLAYESFGQALNCFAKDSAEHIYLPITSGLLSIKDVNPAALAGQNVVLQKITNNGKEIAAQQQHFSSGENYFTFQFDAIFFSDTKKFFYRYKLSGNNEDWIYTNMNYASFSNLPAGNYRFVVQAATDERFQNFAEQQYAFHISKAVWARWWFPVLVSLLLVSLVYVYNNRRLHQLRKFAAMEQQRAHFQYEYLRSQINPHFLFNSLNTLTALIEEEPTKAVAYTENLSDFYRNTITRLEQKLIPLKEELEILDNFIRIQQYRFGKALQVAVEIESELITNILVVPMALQFLVENAIKHNVVSKADPLRVRIYVQDDNIVVANKINRKRQVLAESGLGLENIKQRYAQHTTKKMRHTEDDGYWKVWLPIIALK